MMTRYAFNFNTIDPSWKKSIQAALEQVDGPYLEKLMSTQDWLPGPEKIFNAFSLPINQVNYVLLGESPYPRRESANGYAFWDAAVKELWSPTGLNKKVNRATSLRNIIKMLLIAEGVLDKKNLTQENISKIDKQYFVQFNQELFANFLCQGFLLLNTVLALHPLSSPQKDARAWYPFIQYVLNELLQKRPYVTFLLLGRIANTIDEALPTAHSKKLYAEHPYNHSFITNPEVIQFFRPLHLLRKRST